MRAFVRLGFGLRSPVIESRAHERSKQRMRLQWLRFEFGMELAAQEPRMIGQLANLDVDAVRSLSGEPESMLL